MTCVCPRVSEFINARYINYETCIQRQQYNKRRKKRKKKKSIAINLIFHPIFVISVRIEVSTCSSTRRTRRSAYTLPKFTIDKYVCVFIRLSQSVYCMRYTSSRWWQSNDFNSSNKMPDIGTESPSIRSNDNFWWQFSCLSFSLFANYISVCTYNCSCWLDVLIFWCCAHSTERKFSIYTVVSDWVHCFSFCNRVDVAENIFAFVNTIFFPRARFQVPAFGDI